MGTMTQLTFQEIAGGFLALFAFCLANISLIGNLLVLLTRKRWPNFATHVRRAIPMAVALARPNIPINVERVIEASKELDRDHPVRQIAEELEASLGTKPNQPKADDEALPPAEGGGTSASSGGAIGALGSTLIFVFMGCFSCTPQDLQIVPESVQAAVLASPYIESCYEGAKERCELGVDSDGKPSTCASRDKELASQDLVGPIAEAFDRLRLRACSITENVLPGCTAASLEPVK